MTEFSVLTWNMNHWQRTPRSVKRAGIGSARDSRPVRISRCCKRPSFPPNISGRAVNEPAVIGPYAQWASAVVTSRATEAVRTVKSCYSKAECVLQQTFPGSVQIVSVDVGEAAPIFAVSVYGCWDEHRCADTTMHRILSDLTPLLDGVGWKRTVLGGDFNVSTQTDGSQRPRDATVFARLAALGLVDLLAENKPPRPSLEDCWCDDAGTGRAATSTRTSTPEATGHGTTTTCSRAASWPNGSSRALP